MAEAVDAYLYFPMDRGMSSLTQSRSWTDFPQMARRAGRLLYLGRGHQSGYGKGVQRTGSNYGKGPPSTVSNYGKGVQRTDSNYGKGPPSTVSNYRVFFFNWIPPKNQKFFETTESKK